MKYLSENKTLIFLGDIHGRWEHTISNIKSKKIENAYIISVGDLGIGFDASDEYRDILYKHINSSFKERNIKFYGIRGNHDNPKYFKGKGRIKFSNFELIEDYSVYSYQDKQIQFIGGAVSIDRTARRLGVSYWEDEGVVFEKEKLQKVDILVTHTTPSWCYPQTFNEMVYGWAGEDAYLIEDLNEERSVMDEIFKVCKPSFHVYGHFHSTWSEEINGCRHRLVDINEFFEYR